MNGYREFSSVHLLALRTYRNLAVAIGPVEARDVLRRVPTLPTDEAVALISSLHGKLVRAREDALEAQRALLSIRDEAVYDSETGAADTMTIAELATALGVRTSTLRFWEQAGLVSPERVTSRSVRRYPLSAIREARITAALRAAGYRIPDIRKTMHDIRELHEIDDPIAALQARIDVIAQRTLALLTAGTDLTEIIRNG
ncbi:MerR family transcriptional regulator [Actinopolyspora alba]|uniref:MerR family transcriptional regulator n=1 Tax=Actinopolyspora alba TaxID=673379 RepID=UPI001C31B396|nr:MerR family transcriptional regulator [Actinopolyspora alba]